MVNFEEATRPGLTELDEWRELTVDCHGSHIDENVIDYAYNHRIEVVGYIPHLTHILQGLDVVCFAIFKNIMSDIRRGFEEEGRAITKETFLELIEKPYLAAFTKDSIVTAFRKTGLHPIDRSVISDDMVEPSRENSIQGIFPLPLPPAVHQLTELMRTINISRPTIPVESIDNPQDEVRWLHLVEQKYRCTDTCPHAPSLTLFVQDTSVPSLSTAPHDNSPSQPLTPRRHAATALRTQLQQTSVAFVFGPPEDVTSQDTLPRLLFMHTAPTPHKTRRLLQKPRITDNDQAPEEIRTENQLLWEALDDFVGRHDSSRRMIEGQNAQMALQELTVEVQRKKLVSKEERKGSRKDKLLSTKVGRWLTGDAFRAAVHEDNEDRARKLADKESAADIRARKKAKAEWRKDEVRGRKEIRERDLQAYEVEHARWKSRNEGKTRGKKEKAPVKPKPPVRAATPDRFEVVDGSDNEDDIDDGAAGLSSSSDSDKIRSPCPRPGLKVCYLWLL